MADTITSFTAGDIVVSISGDGDGSGTYTDNQASAITLEEIDPATGTVVGQLVLPQTTTTVNGVTESAISGEYGSSSEGTLEQSLDGHSLTIAGYGIKASMFNAGESNGMNVYGDPRLAQSTSNPNNTSGYTAVQRVVADIGANGTADTSTALYNIYDGQNPRSVATVSGGSFYLSGQGVKGSTNQGVFLANDGASTYSAIYTGVDTRTAELYTTPGAAGPTLYVSSDSSQAKGTGNISSYGISPTGATTPTPLPGITGVITLTAAQANTVNASSVGAKVDLSPENFYFANASTLYIADSGNPKGGTIGDGGLQKWTLNGGTWSLQYTLSSGLGLVANTTAYPGQGMSATTGLIGLAGQTNADGSVSLYATNATVGDLNSTGLYAITDTLAATAPASGEKFTEITPAPADSNIRGVAFAPTAVTCFAAGTLIRTVCGDIAVEALRVGDGVITSSGERRPIKWLGHRTYDCTRNPGIRAVWPVRVAAHAFGATRPSRDLYLSPGHSVCVSVIDELLIPIQELVNGSSIAYVPMDEVTYWHVELDSHDILLANGLPAESFLEMGDNRALLSNDAAANLPVEVLDRSHADFCRLFVDGGPLLDGVREALARRAADLGWAPSRDVEITAVCAGEPIELLVVDGEVTLALPGDAGDVVIRSCLTTPALHGGTDPRRVGLAVYGLAASSEMGETRSLDLDAPELRDGFHAGERDEGRHYRWTCGDLVIPRPLLEGARTLQLTFEPSTIRGWTKPATAAEATPALRAVA